MSILGGVNGKQHLFHKTLANSDLRFLAVAPSGVKTLLRLFTGPAACRSSTFQSSAMGSLLGKDLGAFLLQDRTLGCWGAYKPGKTMLANRAISS